MWGLLVLLFLHKCMGGSGRRVEKDGKGLVCYNASV